MSLKKGDKVKIKTEKYWKENDIFLPIIMRKYFGTCATIQEIISGAYYLDICKEPWNENMLE